MSAEKRCERILTLRDIHVHYGAICALHNVTLRLTCCSAVALIGGNGAGKSTLMKSIVGQVGISPGEIIWNDTPVKRCTHEIAYLPQRADINWDFPMTVRGLVEMGRFPLLGTFHRFGEADEKAVIEAMKTMRIEELARRQVGALSGGQQQRALIARALAQEASVLLLDEPFAGLDQPAQDLLAQLLRKLASDGRLVVASHHDLKTVADIFDQVVLLNRTLIATGKSTETMTEENLLKAFGGLVT